MKGRVEQGKVVVDQPVALPDGTVVEIWPVQLPAKHHPDVERFAGILSPEVDKKDYYEHLRKKHS
jgi:hypothetical protein